MPPVDGRAGGFVGAEAIFDTLGELPPNATVNLFASRASEAIALLWTKNHARSTYPAAVVLSIERQEIWRIDYCPFAIDKEWSIASNCEHERDFANFGA